MALGFSSYIRYSFRDAFRSVGRHKGMAFASITTVAISLFILGFTLLLVVNTQYIVSQMESQVEVIAFLHEEVARQDALALQEKIEKINGIASWEFIPKEEGLATLQNRFGQEADLTQALGGNNPLPDAYRIKSTGSDKVQFLVAELELLEEVENIRYGKEFVDKLLSFTIWVRNIGMAVIIGMLIAGLFLITTTIRLTVFTRKKEINIMKYVGATNWYIRVPFFLEGMLIGFLGALLAGAIIYFGYSAVVDYVLTSVPFIPLITDGQVLYRILGLLLAGGTVLGALGSIVAVRKYLKV